MSIEEITELQRRITPSIEVENVAKLLDELVSLGYAKKIGKMYEHTEKSMKLLTQEGITKELLFTES
jgi:hypothetical protein